MKCPAMLFIGGKDLESRVSTITGLFALNRRGGALWALADEPAAGHIVGRSRDMSIIFFDDVLALRLGDGGVTQTADGEVRLPRRLQGEDVPANRRAACAELSDGVASDGARRQSVAGNDQRETVSMTTSAAQAAGARFATESERGIWSVIARVVRRDGDRVVRLLHLRQPRGGHLGRVLSGDESRRSRCSSGSRHSRSGSRCGHSARSSSGASAISSAASTRSW